MLKRETNKSLWSCSLACMRLHQGGLGTMEEREARLQEGQGLSPATQWKGWQKLEVLAQG